LKIPKERKRMNEDGTSAGGKREKVSTLTSLFEVRVLSHILTLIRMSKLDLEYIPQTTVGLIHKS
jgi:hypothetical protein